MVGIVTQFFDAKIGPATDAGATAAFALAANAVLSTTAPPFITPVADDVDVDDASPFP